MHKHVLIATPLIAPGGGPPGYVYNLMKGIQELTRTGDLKNRFEFFGRRSEKRYKATGERFRPHSILSAMVQLLSDWGLNPLRRRRIQNAKMAMRNADIVVLQGYQDAELARHAQNLGKHTVYMPHSPSIMADEVEMVCQLNNQVVTREFLNRIRETEKQLIRNSDTLAFPSRGSAAAYESSFSELLNKKNVVYLKSGVDIPFAENIYIDTKCAKHNKIRVAFAGRYVSHKGYDLFCDAAEIFFTLAPEVEFCSFGDGPLKGISQRVIDMGWRSDLFTLLHGIDIMVIPNRVAYYDLMPLECAALAKPLVMTAVGGSKDQLCDLPDSVACHEPCAEQLAASIQIAIKRLCDDSSWGLGNRRAYERCFTTTEFAKRWDAAVETLADRR